MSFKDRIKNLWSYQPPSNPEDVKEPLTGGNQFSLKQELKARVQTMLNWFKRPVRQNSDSYVYDEYFLLLFQKNYFVNLFDIDTEDKDFKKCWNLFVELCFWYGDAAIINGGIDGLEDTTSLIPVYLKTKNFTPLGEIEKNFEYCYGAELIPLMNGDNKGNIDKMKLKYRINTNEFVYGKWNTQCYGAWVWMYKFAKFQKDLMKMTHNSAYLQREILFMNVNNVGSVEDDANQIFNPDINVITQLGVDWENDGKMQNRWMVDAPSQDKTMTINEVYDWHINTYYDLFGRRRNVDFKKERNVVSEVDASQEQFDILVNETYKYMELALKECKEKFGKEGEFKYGGNSEKDNGNTYSSKGQDSEVSSIDSGKDSRN